MLRTAHSNHSKCFICGRKKQYIYQISRKAISEAFIRNKIVIKDHARCCRNHLDSNGLIKQDEFSKIKTDLNRYERSLIKILEDLTSKLKDSYNSIFEPFQNLEILTDEHYINITGWNKKTFSKFASYITSIHFTAKRSKEQLIAFYRFWLRKGTDQQMLGNLNNTSQLSMSNFLARIRKAINRDFVPFFLGAKSRTRDFFCG